MSTKASRPSSLSWLIHLTLQLACRRLVTHGGIVQGVLPRVMLQCVISRVQAMGNVHVAIITGQDTHRVGEGLTGVHLHMVPIVRLEGEATLYASVSEAREEGSL